MCHESITKGDLHFFPILHFKLCPLDFCETVLYHIVAGHKEWSEASQYSSRILKDTKQQVIDEIFKLTNILIDTPCRGGGNTNSGPLADLFF